MDLKIIDAKNLPHRKGLRGRLTNLIVYNDGFKLSISF